LPLWRAQRDAFITFISFFEVAYSSENPPLPVAHLQGSKRKEKKRKEKTEGIASDIRASLYIF
jgi:hypothetical protein